MRQPRRRIGVDGDVMHDKRTPSARVGRDQQGIGHVLIPREDGRQKGSSGLIAVVAHVVLDHAEQSTGRTACRARRVTAFIKASH